jgi:hypothetical protein
VQRKADDARWAEYRQEIDTRIEKLVSAIGAFIAAQGGKQA